MRKILFSLLIIMFTFTMTSFAAEEEEAQTRPRPLMHQQKLSKSNDIKMLKARPGTSGAGVMYDNDKEEEAQPPSEPDPPPDPEEINTSLMVPDEEEEETGMINPSKAGQIQTPGKTMLRVLPGF